MSEDDIYKIFIKWYSMPPESRDPKTIPLFCEKMNIQLATIAGFYDRESFSEDLLKQAKQWGKSKIPELLHMLYRQYKEKKNPNDLRMYKELLELDKEIKNGPTFNFNLLNPSEDQYRSIIAREARTLALDAPVTTSKK